MSASVYLNGDFVAAADAKVSVFDRGLLMSDGVYEITGVLDGKLIDYHAHFDRLQRSLDALSISNPLSRAACLEVMGQLIKANALVNGLVYLHITRGNPGYRDFVYPQAADAIAPTIFMFTQVKQDLATTAVAQTGIAVITLEDIRWRLRSIKTAQLLFASMAKVEAQAQGADDAWLVEEGYITEGTSNNAHIIQGNTLITRPTDNSILPGITRKAILKFAQENQLNVEERRFTVQEAQEADEAFITAATTWVIPVVSIDGAKVGTGEVGPYAKRLRQVYIEECRKSAI